MVEELLPPKCSRICLKTLWNGGFLDKETLPFNSAVVLPKGLKLFPFFLALQLPLYLPHHPRHTFPKHFLSVLQIMNTDGNSWEKRINFPYRSWLYFLQNSFVPLLARRSFGALCIRFCWIRLPVMSSLSVIFICISA